VPWLNTEDLAEQREMLTEAQYAQLHLNRWVESEDRLTSVDDLRAFGPVCVFRLLRERCWRATRSAA